MFSEDCVVEHSHNIVLIILILRFEVAQKLQLNSCLVLEALLVSNDFNSDNLLVFVVKALQGLSKTTRAKFV